MKKTLILLMLAMLLLPCLSAFAAQEDGAEQPTAAVEPEKTPVAEQTDMQQNLQFTVPEQFDGYKWRLNDGVLMSRIAIKAGEQITATFTDAQQGVALQWYALPAACDYTQYAADGSVLEEGSLSTEQLNVYLPLEESCRSLTLTATAPCAISELNAYPAAQPLPETVQRWQTVEKADLMVLVSDPGAEFSEFSGVLPLYAGEHGAQTVVVYMTCMEKRSRAEEALSALWSMGMTNQPVLGERYARNYDMLSIVEQDWNENEAADWLAALIDRYQPKVLVTHDGTDETDRFPTRGYTARCAEQAVEKADWKVSKLYWYAPANEDGVRPEAVTTPDFQQRLVRFASRTAAETAQSLYSNYATQQVYTRTVDAEAAFVLRRSEVGEDTARNDLFEHIDLASLIRYEQPEPSPAPTAVPLPDAAPAATEPADSGEDACLPETNLGRLSGGEQTATVQNLLPVIIGALLAVAVLVLLRKKMNHAWAVALAFVPITAGILLYFLLGGTLTLRTTRSPAAPAVSAEPSATPEPTPAPTDTPEPTATPIPASMMEDTYFRTADEPDEVIVYDSEHGHWEYRTDLLSISIDREDTVNDAGKPLVYFVADIRMKNINQFRPAFGSEGHTGMGATYPWIIARRAKAVLWLTGDNMINSDRDEKGVIIRDGRLFLDEEVEDTMALYPDMTMRIYPKWNQYSQQILEDGVENTFSFGPTLVQNGVANPDARKHRVRRANPRVGIGMLEPGHFLAICVDGRQKNYSVGMTIEDFADLFVAYGCETAYNMDGGLSAGMIFMGEQLNSHGGKRTGNKNDLSYQRPVPDGLIFGYSEQVPGVDDPIENAGNKEK